MYERFTDRARKVMQLANQEAQRFNHEYVGTEHVLLGLGAEGSGVAANVLKNLDINLHAIRHEVERVVDRGPDLDDRQMGPLPPNQHTEKVIEYAIKEARGLHHNYVGTEHLLLGLLRVGEGVATQVLTNLGLNLETVRTELLQLLGAPPTSPRPDVFHIAKSLEPESAETYPISASTPPTPINAEQLQMISDRVRHLNEQTQVFVATMDFVLAARCRDEAEGLKQLLAWYEWASGQQ